MASIVVRLSGLAAILGGVLGIVLTPILMYQWATYSDTYGYYGRAYFLVFLGCLLGLAELYALRRASMGTQDASKPDTERWVFGLTLVGLVVLLVGDILEYWGGTPARRRIHYDADAGFQRRDIRSSVDTIRLGSIRPHLPTGQRPTQILALVVDCCWAWGLILSVPHIPSGTMFLCCCAWVALGYLLLTGKVASAEQPVRVS